MFPLEMVIFHSYVSSPGGKWCLTPHDIHPFQWCRCRYGSIVTSHFSVQRWDTRIFSVEWAMSRSGCSVGSLRRFWCEMKYFHSQWVCVHSIFDYRFEGNKLNFWIILYNQKNQAWFFLNHIVMVFSVKVFLTPIPSNSSFLLLANLPSSHPTWQPKPPWKEGLSCESQSIKIN